MPLQATSGAASYDAFGGGVPVVPTYIEDVFSTYLYTGNASSLTITNGIDLAGKGGLVWFKNRQNGDQGHVLVDTLRGQYGLTSNATVANEAIQNGTLSFNSNGFAFSGGLYTGSGDINGFNNDKYVSWTFRKQPKFFDVVTYTGTGSAQNISHNLGSTPACMFIKATNASGSWAVYHRSFPNPTVDYLILNATFSLSDLGPNTAYWNSTNPTSTQFTVGTNANVNASETTYVAYLFAHNAGGFGLTGTDNVISCGSFNTDGAGMASVSLGYEPQFLMYKRTNITGNWQMADNMRGMSVSATSLLYANKTDAETTFGPLVIPTATGFNYEVGDASNTYIYIAIRRGPMKVPTSGTSVFTPIARTGTASDVTVSGVGFPPDLVIPQARTSNYQAGTFFDRLRGNLQALFSNATTAETTISQAVKTLTMDGFTAGIDNSYEAANAARTYANWCFRRAPNFFDEVCYTGAGNGTVISHNLGVEPELAIFKCRSTATRDWVVRAPGTGSNRYLLFTTAAQADASGWYSATSSQITFATSYAGTAESGLTFVAYLFATCAGVSKCGTFTGNGSSQTINCGFTGGARFVMVKATSATGNWIVADSARGIVAGNDPALYLNSTAAEVTGLDWIDADNSGFVVNETATIAANTNGVSYIFFAVA